MNNNAITKKKAFLLLACVWFIISFSVVQTTYAKYVTNLDANANITISYWNISVNKQDIMNNSDLSGHMTAVIPRSTYAKEGVIVPGATGYFDLEIDSSKVNVAFSVIVSATINETSSLTTDFVLSGYSLDNGITIAELADEETSFTCNIAADTTSTIIRVYTTWLDDGLDSTEDTSLGISGGTAILDVNLKFEQIV